MILQGKDLTKHYSKINFSGFKMQSTVAVNDVSIDIPKATTIGLVGESGSGKSTLGDLLGDIQKPTSGTVLYKGQDISNFDSEKYLEYRKNVQFIFQNPQASMNPYFTIQQVLLEPLESLDSNFNKKEALNQIETMLINIGLDSSYLNKYPRELSGGQCQRIAIGRALLLNPEVVICDEAVSALDVSVQAQILNLLKELQEQFSTSYLFISHDMATVKYMSKELIVMYRGNIVEQGLAEEVLSSPQDEYTKKLLHYVQLKHI